MDKGNILRAKSTYTAFFKENSLGDIISAVVIAVQALLATTVILYHIIS